MAQESDEIKQHIDQRRDQLTRDLRELENQVKHEVKQATDLRAHYDKKPGALLGAAFGGGLLLALLVRRE